MKQYFTTIFNCLPIFIPLILLFVHDKPVGSKPLYLLFPQNGHKQMSRVPVSIDRIDRRVAAYDTVTLYQFPCKTKLGDYRFVSIDHNVQKKSRHFLKNIPVRNCQWIDQYKGSGLNGYNQKSEFGPIYIVEKISNSSNIIIRKVTPDFAEYDYVKDY